MPPTNRFHSRFPDTLYLNPAGSEGVRNRRIQRQQTHQGYWAIHSHQVRVVRATDEVEDAIFAYDDACEPRALHCWRNFRELSESFQRVAPVDYKPPTSKTPEPIIFVLISERGLAQHAPMVEAAC